MLKNALRAVAAGAAALALAGTVQATTSAATPAKAHAVVGHVYQPTNNADSNTIAVFNRYADGSLKPAGTVATGGKGTGSSLASQGGIVRDGNLVFVVNAGSDSVSVLKATGKGLKLRDTISSGGDRPVSVTVRGGIGYVLNQGSDTIRGFRYTGSGDLLSLPGSTRHLSADASDAAQIQFTPNGKALVVTQKATGTIDTFSVRRGIAGGARAHESAGQVPYGFDFDRRGTLVVSEAAGSSASSYKVTPRFRTVTAALTDGQAAACWVVVSGNYAYVVNGANATISTYRISAKGSLTLVQAVAVTTGAGPTDATVAGRYLYVRVGSGEVESYRLSADGSLTAVGSAFVTTNYGVAGLASD